MRLEDGPLPLYFQLQQKLRASIEAGETKAGSFLPSETRMCEMYGVSRITVQRALNVLATSGLISRRRGVGTIVNSLPVKSVVLTGSLDEIVSPAPDLSQKVLSCAAIIPPLVVSQTFQLKQNERVTRLDTMFFSGGKPFSYAELFFPENDWSQNLTSEFAEGRPMIRAVEESLGQSVARAEQAIEPAVADSALTERLDVKLHAPILRTVRTYYLESNRPVLMVIALYHPERYRYTVQLVRGRTTQ